MYQAVADQLHIAIVGVFATNQLRPDSFEWSELPSVDLAQVSESLETAERSKHVRFSNKILFGFSQGACVAAELSARHPELFAGAILLSPGGKMLPGPLPVSQGNVTQLYYVLCGAGEASGNLEFARRYAESLAKTGAKVQSREVADMKIHSRPPDWPERFPEWVATILAAKR